MSYYLCFHCARSAGYSTNAETELLLANDYQLGKFIKHTRRERIYDVNSVFADPSTNAYRELIVESAAAGSVEIDDLGRVNFTWVAGVELGATFRDGVLWDPDDALRIVLPFSEDRLHAYPVGSSGLSGLVCSNCGAPIVG